MTWRRRLWKTVRRSIFRELLKQLDTMELPLADVGEKLGDEPPQVVERVFAVFSSSSVGEEPVDEDDGVSTGGCSWAIWLLFLRCWEQVVNVSVPQIVVAGVWCCFSVRFCFSLLQRC